MLEIFYNKSTIYTTTYNYNTVSRRQPKWNPYKIKQNHSCRRRIPDGKFAVPRRGQRLCTPFVFRC